jgi:hypothetical protein
MLLFIILHLATAETMLNITPSGLSSTNFDIIQIEHGRKLSTSVDFGGYETSHHYRM